jgi:hypothetical protein
MFTKAITLLATIAVAPCEDFAPFEHTQQFFDMDISGHCPGPGTHLRAI